MTSGTSSTSVIDTDLQSILRQYWGFDTLRPLQADAIRAGVKQRDSLVVLPTGGGKSLCYQVPPLLAGRCDIVVSPLISLMKDQVDGLVANGYPAAAIHSNLTIDDRRGVQRDVQNGKFNLLFVAPERLLSSAFLNMISQLDVRAFAIDEAHCISQWGHDFRPEYRRLAELKSHFPQASIHAYTATATPRVRTDIIEQLGLNDPQVLVGTFDRPNLVYRVVQMVHLDEQILEVIRRHQNEAVIVYCISRKDTESLATTLQTFGIKAAHYHGGMEKGDRSRVQESFANEQLDVVVATVAFGMGIDRSNVRCVIHAAMPKSVEHYQQETGRAGRDGLEAECIMLQSGRDYIRWERLIEFSAEKVDNEPLRQQTIDGQLELLRHISRLCTTPRCRHAALSEYFGQQYDKDNCGACDVCLDEIEYMADSTTTAQKIISCVARLDQRFGIGYVVDVLTGADTEQIRRFNHNALSTYGLMRDVQKKALQNLVYQLIDQGLLGRTEGDRPVLVLNDNSLAVLKGEKTVQLIEPRTAKVRKAIAEEVSWEHVDRGLFDSLRSLRRELAHERAVPPFIIFGDAVLRELASVRPGSLQSFVNIHGIGQRKLHDFGQVFVDHIVEYCDEHGLDLDVRERLPRANRSSKSLAMIEMFKKGSSVSAVAETFGVTPGTATKYLCEHIKINKPDDISMWIDPQLHERIEQAARASDDGRLKPIFEALDGAVSYDTIRIVVTHINADHD